MTFYKISPRDIEGAQGLKVDVGLSLPYSQSWIVCKGKKYYCCKIANEDWTVTEITEFPFAVMKGGDTHMMKKKGMTKNQKLKSLKTSKAKKKVKATKK